MIDKELIHQAAEDIDIFEADLTEEYDRLCKQERKPSPVIILIGLFFFVNVPSPAAQPNTNEAHHNYISNLPGSTLKDVYTRHQKQDNLISYNQLRKLCHENK